MSETDPKGRSSPSRPSPGEGSGVATIELRVRLFGAFRRWAPGGAVTIAAPQGATAADVRRLVAAALAQGGAGEDGAALLQRSALADEQRLLGEGWTVPAASKLELAVLPPVCGG